VKKSKKIPAILAAVDDAVAREAIRERLAGAGYEVDTAGDSGTAFSALKKREYAFIIVGWELAGHDGLEILRQAKSRQGQLKGIVLSADPSVQAAVEALKAGATEYMTMPCDLNRLEASVKAAVGTAQAATQQPAAAGEVPAGIPENLRDISDSSMLIQILLAIQKQNRWLPEDALVWVSRKIGVSMTQIYHIATFYKAFSLKPQGRHEVAVCLGTACHVRGASRLLDKVMDALQIRPDQTTSDLEFSLKTVNCLGCCALGPVMMVDDNYYSNPSAEEIKEIFKDTVKPKDETLSLIL
jgi:NADH-quinone oxidoreductase subunit E